LKKVTIIDIYPVGPIYSFLIEKTMNHAEGSLEWLVSNLVKVNNENNF
jgi:hypothetical protein